MLAKSKVGPYRKKTGVRDGWCGCTKESRLKYQPAPDLRDNYAMELMGAKRYGLARVLRIKLIVNKPIEEPFEIKGPKIKSD